MILTPAPRSFSGSEVLRKDMDDTSRSVSSFIDAARQAAEGVAAPVAAPEVHRLGARSAPVVAAMPDVRLEMLDVAAQELDEELTRPLSPTKDGQARALERQVARRCWFRHGAGGLLHTLLVVCVGIAAAGTLIVTLTNSQPHPLAAALAAVLGWLAVYAVMLQQECRLLTAWFEGDGGICGRKEGGEFAVRAAGSAAQIAKPCPVLADSEKQAALSVMASALVSDYLRCATILRHYQEVHPGPPLLPKDRRRAGADPEELLRGLRADPRAIPVREDVRPVVDRGSVAATDSPIGLPYERRPSASASTDTCTQPAVSSEAEPGEPPEQIASRWLAEDTATPPLNDTSRGPSIDNIHSLPAWLRQLTPGGASALHSESQTGHEPSGSLDTSGTLPTWMRQLAAVAGGGPLASPAAASVQEPSAETATPARPQAGGTSLDTSANLPTWMRQMASFTAPAAVGEGVGSRSNSADGECAPTIEDTADMPAWLRQVRA